MLSLFPDLLDWSWYVPLFFRCFLGAYCVYVGWILLCKESKTEDERDRFAWVCLASILFFLGILFAIGLYAQALGSIGFVLALFTLYLRIKNSPHVTESMAFYLLVSMVSLSLVFLGAGPYAFDLPL